MKLMNICTFQVFHLTTIHLIVNIKCKFIFIQNTIFFFYTKLEKYIIIKCNYLIGFI